MCDRGYSNEISNKCTVGQQWLDDPLSWLLDWMTRCSAVDPQYRHNLTLNKSFYKVTLLTTSRTETILFKTDKKGLLCWIRIVIRWNVFMLTSDSLSNIVSKKGENTMNNYNVHIYIYIYICVCVCVCVCTEWCQSHCTLTVKLVTSVKPWKTS
jgi:hypothetical protein